MRKTEAMRIYYRILRATRTLQKFGRMVIAWERFYSACENKYERIEAEKKRLRYIG
jgi:uncharacterized protein YlbG (UPF0298 family)